MEKPNIVHAFVQEGMREKERKLHVSLGTSSSKCLLFSHPRNGVICSCSDSMGTIRGDCVLCDGTGFLGGYSTQGISSLCWPEGIAVNIQISEDRQRMYSLNPSVGSEIYFPHYSILHPFQRSFSCVHKLTGDYVKVDVNIEEAMIYKKLSLTNLFEFGAIEAAFTFAGEIKPKDAFLRLSPALGLEIWQVMNMETYRIRDIQTHQGTLRMLSPSIFTYNVIAYKVKEFLEDGSIRILETY